MKARQAILKRKQQKQRERKASQALAKSKIVSELSRYGGEWKNAKVVDEQLAKLKTENQKRTALELQIRYHKNILLAQEILPTEKKKLLKITRVPVNELKNNLKKILTLSPHLELDLQVM